MNICAPFFEPILFPLNFPLQLGNASGQQIRFLQLRFNFAWHTSNAQHQRTPLFDRSATCFQSPGALNIFKLNMSSQTIDVSLILSALAPEV